MNQRGGSLVGIDGNRHAHVGGVAQSDVVQCAQLREPHVLRVLVVRPASQLHIQERQILLVEYRAVLVDERRHVGLVFHCRGRAHGIVTTLIPEHACHVKSAQGRDMVRVDVTAAQMPADRCAAPCGLDDADRYIGMFRSQLHGELLGEVAQMPGIVVVRRQPAGRFVICGDQREIVGCFRTGFGVGGSAAGHMVGDDEMHIRIDQLPGQILLSDQTIAEIIGYIFGRIVLRVVELHIRLAGGHEHIAHVYPRKLVYDAPVV